MDYLGECGVNNLQQTALIACSFFFVFQLVYVLFG